MKYVQKINEFINEIYGIDPHKQFMLIDIANTYTDNPEDVNAAADIRWKSIDDLILYLKDSINSLKFQKEFLNNIKKYI